MQKIMLLMQRRALVSNLKSKLSKNNEFTLIHQSNYDLVKNALPTDTKIFLIEVAESGKFDIGYCLNLTRLIRKSDSKSKILLMCSDHDEKSINLVLKAKREGLINDFVFYDVTIDYLSSKILTLQI